MKLGNGIEVKLGQVDPDLLPGIATGVVSAAKESMRYGDIGYPENVGGYAVKPVIDFGDGLEVAADAIKPRRLPKIAHKVLEAAQKHGVELPFDYELKELDEIHEKERNAWRYNRAPLDRNASYLAGQGDVSDVMRIYGMSREEATARVATGGVIRMR